MSTRACLGTSSNSITIILRRQGDLRVPCHYWLHQYWGNDHPEQHKFGSTQILPTKLRFIKNRVRSISKSRRLHTIWGSVLSTKWLDEVSKGPPPIDCSPRQLQLQFQATTTVSTFFYEIFLSSRCPPCQARLFSVGVQPSLHLHNFPSFIRQQLHTQLKLLYSGGRLIHLPCSSAALATIRLHLTSQRKQKLHVPLLGQKHFVADGWN